MSPFKLPHYGLPAFPALALLVARVWDESIEATPQSLRPRTLLVPAAVLFALAAVAAAVAWSGVLPVPAYNDAGLPAALRQMQPLLDTYTRAQLKDQEVQAKQEAQQDEAAHRLQAGSGWKQWPACARQLGLRKLQRRSRVRSAAARDALPAAHPRNAFACG